MRSRKGDSRDRTALRLYLLAALAVAAQLAALVWWLHWRFLRLVVEGESMTPALQPGDYVVVDRRAYRRLLPRPGHVVLARDPRDPSRPILKRVDHVDLHGNLWLLGDNPDASTDSRTFGAVSRDAIIGRVRWRYWPLRSLFHVR